MAFGVHGLVGLYVATSPEQDFDWSHPVKKRYTDCSSDESKILLIFLLTSPRSVYSAISKVNQKTTSPHRA